MNTKKMVVKRIPKCRICKENEAVWAMQFIGEDTPTFSALGWYYRGFTVFKVCEECKEIMKSPEAMEEYLKSVI